MYGIKRDDIDAGALIPSKLGSELKRMTQVIHVGAVAADSNAIKTPLWSVAKALTIKRIMLGFNAAVTAADTNYQTIAITDDTNTIAEVDTGPVSGGESFAAGVLEALTLVADYVALSAADQLYVEYTKTGSGMALTGMTVQVDYELDDPS